MECLIIQTPSINCANFIALYLKPGHFFFFSLHIFQWQCWGIIRVVVWMRKLNIWISLYAAADASTGQNQFRICICLGISIFVLVIGFVLAFLCFFLICICLGTFVFVFVIAKDCLLTLVKGRLALGSPGCSFVCHHAENGPIHRKMVVDYPLVIISKVKLFFRPIKRNEWSSQSFA